MIEATQPEFLVIGHITQDLLPDGSLSLGGTISYAATTAERMGYRVGVVTSTGPDLDVAKALPFAQISCRRSAKTTVFENIYLNGERKQILHQRAGTLCRDDVPEEWRSVPIAHLGPLDQEINEGIFHCFDDTVLIGVTPQGFLRRWDDGGRVSFVNWNPPESVLKRINVLVLSEQDVPDPGGLARAWTQFIEVIVVTRAEKGATVFHEGEPRDYPVRSADQVDPTGAGDVFAAAFMIRMFETKNPCQAAQFANAVASFSIEGPGVHGIPTRDQVEAYLKTLGNSGTYPTGIASPL